MILHMYTTKAEHTPGNNTTHVLSFQESSSYTLFRFNAVGKNIVSLGNIFLIN